jgi:hypothetical protein
VRVNVHGSTLRSVLLFMTGLAGVIFETVVVQVMLGRDPYDPLLVLFAAMMGLPAFLTVDEARKQPPEKEEKP